jgi:GT2 family glycosyltransferase
VTDLPTFSVVIPTYARPERLRACLAALPRLDYPSEHFEVVVVDDGSPSPLDAVVAPFRSRVRLTLFRQPNRGPAAARNAGAARAAGAFLAFTDDDCAPEPGWLAALRDRFAAVPNQLLGGRTVNALPSNPFSAASQDLLDYLYEYFPRAHGLSPFFASNNLAVPAARFHQLGGFDEDFPLAAGEDRDFCDRWRERGWPAAFAGDAVVRHAHHLSLRPFWRQHFNYGRGAAHLQAARARRLEVYRLKPEPLGFYAGMLRYPFAHYTFGKAALRTLLMALSQTATAAGYMSEAGPRARHRQGSS